MADFKDTDITSLFERAADHVKHLLPQIPPEKLLEIYAHYKQATTGPCNTSRPRFYEIQARAKWDAWRNLRNMSSDQSKREYVRIITELDPEFPAQKTVKTDGWAVVSCHLNTDALLDENEKTVFDFCKEDNLPQLRVLLEKNPEFLDARDENGMGLVHWAADRGNGDILRFLVGNNADLNMADAEGQTALHYATSCDYVACVEVLLNAGADCNLSDNDGLKPVDLTTDSDLLKLFKQFM